MSEESKSPAAGWGEQFENKANRNRVRRLNAERFGFNTVGDKLVGVITHRKEVIDKRDGDTFSVYTFLTERGDVEITASGLLGSLLEKCRLFADLVLIEFTGEVATGKQQPLKQYEVRAIPIVKGMLPPEVEENLANAEVDARSI